ncbi:MAG: cytochrome P460 family protein [Spirochaetes bacterium]|nr:cytochrome P460 family protein [Spirochaetota bacterium]MBU0955847.1 cytochrome P460 family protein [Spirochaetota bacterium]
MKKNRFFLVFLRLAAATATLFLVLSIISCQKSRNSTLSSRPDFASSSISAAVLWEHINQGDQFKRWPAWPDYEGLRPGQSPHGRFHRIYISQPLADALPVATNVAPPGSIIIKENYDPDRKVAGYTIMAKVAGYNPDAGDWFWAAYGPDGAVMAEGKPEMCISCHAASASDFVLLQRLDFGGGIGQ